MSTYAAIIVKKEYNDPNMSIGFRRMVCIPVRMRKAMHQNYMISNKKDILNEISKTGKVDDGSEYIKAFFENMTEVDFRQYVNTH